MVIEKVKNKKVKKESVHALYDLFLKACQQNPNNLLTDYHSNTPVQFNYGQLNAWVNASVKKLKIAPTHLCLKGQRAKQVYSWHKRWQDIAKAVPYEPSVGYMCIKKPVVIVWLGNGLNFLHAMLLLAALDCIAVFVDRRSPWQLVHQLSKDLGATGIITQEPHNRQQLGVGLALGHGSTYFNLGFDHKRLDNYQLAFLTHRASTHISLSSGSTGIPKCILMHQKGFLSVLEQQTKALGLNEKDHMLWALSPQFDASLSDIGCAFFAKASLSMAPIKSYKLIGELLKSISCMDMPIALLGMYQKALEQSALKSMIIGGALASSNLLRGLLNRGIKVLNAYGPTETSICSSFKCLEAMDFDAPLIANIGQPIFGMHYRGHEGCLSIRGIGVGMGYWQIKQNHKRFESIAGQRIFHTSDAVYQNANDWYIVGRVDRVFKKHGQLIDPQQIEQVLSGFGYRVFVGIHDEQLVLLINLQTSAVDKKIQEVKRLNLWDPRLDLLMAANKALPSYMQIQRIYQISNWPLLSNDKQDIQALNKLIKEAHDV